MLDQPSTGSACLTETHEVAEALLDILVSQHPTLLAIDELVRMYAGFSREARVAEALVQDGLSELLGSGLVNRLGDYVFASRAAMRATELVR